MGFVEFVDLLGGKGRCGKSSEGIWYKFSGSEAVEGVGEVPRRSSKEGSSKNWEGNCFIFYNETFKFLYLLVFKVS